MSFIPLAGSLILAVAGCPGQAGYAKPGAVRTFAASGSFGSGAQLSGTVTVDAGEVVAVHVKVSGATSMEFDRVERQSSAGYAYIVQMAPRDRAWPKLIMGERTSPISLKDYMGGPLGPRTDILDDGRRVDLLRSGKLTLLPAETGCPRLMS